MTRTATFTSIAALAASAALAGCVSPTAPAAETLGVAQLAKADGTPAGLAQIVAVGDQLSINVTASGIEPGAHGFHLHTTGACRAPDFTSAGGHLNPTDNEHGMENPDGSHFGDLPNLQVGAGGTASASFDLGHGRDRALEWLFDADGTAVVIHAGADDYRTNPSGNAGPRVACGVLERA
ncbi:superoxide dismutase family protein [Altererythrobacter marinus]|uniref:Superoxide dismutase family protein n=1 Tax=Pelagerythrobacter marinus TaxID=538382 RepID=A0ABW9UV43_9SPHN|nr:superoxide dismutase family protein [Pelagerythrobacter marinus]MEC9066525.1 superoxide dismutase family protein [Pseudomonadota bacterium]MXO68716.1 superoxide dismutase family protein [Pelagerythrobacter marinus]